MTQQQIKNSFFICLSILIFIVDLSLFAILQQHLLLLLHCFIVLLMAHQYQNRIIFPPLFLLSLLSYLDTNIFGSCLIYMLPTLFLAKYFKEHLQNKTVIPYLLLITSFIIKYWTLNFIKIPQLSWQHCLMFMIYNLICLIFFNTMLNYGQQRFCDPK